MDFKATPTTIDNLLSGRKQYTVPRNQREFSWGEEQIREFWEDLLFNIKYRDNKFEFDEYFIGTIVLAGDEDGFELQIVDGQQRLTVLTILIRALAETLCNLGENDKAKAIYTNYIEGLNIEAAKYFKLNRDSTSDYFKSEIQHLPKCNEVEIEGREDTLLTESFEYLSEQLTAEYIAGSLYNKNQNDLLHEEHLSAIMAVNTQLTTKVKVIKVVVDNEDDAYTIFEILNARGMDLDSADLIKNKVFSCLREGHPVDFAKRKWDAINNELSKRDNSINMSTFLRHWWNSRYPIVSEGSLYKQFKDKLYSEELTAEFFVNDLEKTSKLYAKLLSPSIDDWSENNAKQLFFSLNAFRVFNISLNRPLILALFDTFVRKKLKLKVLLETLEQIENFHFVFTAVCSLRPTGVESSYSMCSRKLRKASNKGESKQAIDELLNKLKDRLPSEAYFTDKFKQIKFVNSVTKHKKLIQYIFVKHERFIRCNNELYPMDLSLEHINPQSSKIDNVGLIGNLIPLSAELNSEADKKVLQQKMIVFRKSNYEVVSQFCDKYQEVEVWSKAKITERTLAIAKSAYREIWKMK